MNQQIALKLIRTVAADSERIVILDHARSRMRERHIDFLQVQRCLQRGVIAEGPYPMNSRTVAWRCNVERTVSGDRLCVVVEFSDDPANLLVITVMNLR